MAEEFPAPVLAKCWSNGVIRIVLGLSQLTSNLSLSPPVKLDCAPSPSNEDDKIEWLVCFLLLDFGKDAQLVNNHLPV